jgi:surface antigen
MFLPFRKRAQVKWGASSLPPRRRWLDYFTACRWLFMISFMLPFSQLVFAFSGTNVCFPVDECNWEKFSTWSPTAGRIWLEHNDGTNYTLHSNFIWTKNNGFTEKSPSYEHSIVLNNHDLLECRETVKKDYKTFSVNISRKSTTDCKETSVKSNFEDDLDFYVDTRTLDNQKKNGRDFAFGIKNAEKLRTNKEYFVNFLLTIDNKKKTESRVMFKPSLTHWTSSDNTCISIFGINASAQKIDKFCELNKESLGEPQACIFETPTGCLNLLKTADPNGAVHATRAEFQKGENSPIVPWCMKDIKDNWADSSLEAINNPDLHLEVPGSMKVDLLECEDVDWIVIEPNKNGIYRLSLDVPKGSDFDFFVYPADGESRDLIVPATEWKAANKANFQAGEKFTTSSGEEKDSFYDDTQEVMELRLLSNSKYYVKFVSNASWDKNHHGGWYGNFKVTNTETQNIPVDINSLSYFAPFNPFDQQDDTWYECTRYAFGRTHEKMGTVLTFSQNYNRHGGRWYDLVNNPDLEKGSEPRSNSLAVWEYGEHGHVAFVEEVDGDKVIISEANWASPPNGKYNGTKEFTKESIKQRGNYNIVGYIYLEFPSINVKILDENGKIQISGTDLGTAGSITVDGKTVQGQWTADGITLNTGIVKENLEHPARIKLINNSGKIFNICYPFIDVCPDPYTSWYASPIITLWKKGIVNGYGGNWEGYFRPNEPVSRAEFVSVTVRALDANLVRSENPSFNDIKGDEWYAAYVQYAKKKELIQGCDSDKFCPSKPISRAAGTKVVVTAFLKDTLAAFKYLGKQPVSKFEDVQNSKEWFYPYIYAAQEKNVVGGYSSGYFKPGQAMTRAEMAVIISRARAAFH